jgi:hypothetical protein
MSEEILLIELNHSYTTIDNQYFKRGERLLVFNVENNFVQVCNRSDVLLPMRICNVLIKYIKE